MGISKTHLFTLEQNNLANIAKVFSHPARIAILQYLLKTNACINSDLVQELGLAQATVSQHLRELKEVGIIQGTIEGACVSYCINPEKWLEIRTILIDFFGQFDHSSTNSNDCC